MKRITLLGLCTLLAACGADGDPVTPSLNTSVSITPSGVSTSTGVSLRKGPLSVGLAR